MVMLARRALVEPPAPVALPVETSAAASARRALDAIQADIAAGEATELSDPGPDGRARALTVRARGGTISYAWMPPRALARNGGAVTGVYVSALSFRRLGQVLEIELVATDREGQASERRLVVLTLKGKG